MTRHKRDVMPLIVGIFAMIVLIAFIVWAIYSFGSCVASGGTWVSTAFPNKCIGGDQ